MARLLGLVVLVLSLLTVTECNKNKDCDDSPKDQTGMSGTFKSHPTFPQGIYHRGSNCDWLIKVPPGYFIHIHFDTSFNIEPNPPKNPGCGTVDYITFQRSGTVMKGPFCGFSAPPDFSIYHNDVKVIFNTDSSGQLGGFSLTWTAFSALLDSGCGSPRFQSGFSGKISSMYYPDLYENNARCDWVIRVPVGYRIKLHFDSTFDVENEGGSCKDSVTTKDTDKTELLCNSAPSNTTAPKDVTSWNNYIPDLKFNSNSNTRRKGFSITWTAISAVQPSGCGQVNQTGMSGSFSSMNYPSAYDAKAYCFWRITVADGYRIRLHFNARFNTENHHDIVAIHEESSGPVIYGPFSGKTAPSDILSRNKDLTVVFTSDPGTQKEGFQVTWTAIKVPEKFGTNKDLICHCKMGVQCDSTTGVCPNKECAPGWSGDDCQTGNAASGQPAKQSSTYTSTTAAGRAVDGSQHNTMNMYSCSHTADPPENQPWWRVDLGKRFFLFYLTLSNRAKWDTECPASAICNSQLGNLVAWMSDVDNPDPAKGRTCVTYTGLVSFGAKQQLTCSSPIIGRYLFIKSLNSPAALSLCEVVTNAVQYKDCTGQHFGPGCKHRCRCEDRKEQCDSATGACVSKCIYDYDGEACDKLMPFMKQSLTVTSRTGSSIKVSTPAWSKVTDGGDGTVVKYMLQYRLKDAQTWTNFTEKMTSTGSGYSLDVIGLTAVTAYQFRVVLLNKRIHENDEMLGRPGPVLDANTPCPAVVKPKINDITTGIDSSGTWPERAYLLLKIDNFITAGMPLGCFRNYYVKIGNQGYEVTSSTTLEYKLQHMKAYTAYTVHLLLSNNDGKSAKSDDVTKRTAEDTPGEVSKLAATQQGKTLRLTWLEPTIKNGDITGYLVEHKQTGHGQCGTISGSTVASPTLAATTLSYDIPENVMCAYCRYDITVKASTSAGIGKPAGLTNEYTAAAVPTKSSSTPVVVSTSSKQIIFKWNAAKCEEWNGPDGKYHYLVQQNGNEVKKSSTIEVKAQVDGLVPYTLYHIKVALWNSKGTGPYSTDLAVRTGAEAPAQVASLNVEPSATSLKVTWTPPTAPNGQPRTHYKVGLKHLRYGPGGFCTIGVSSSWVYEDTTGPVQEYTLSTCAYCMYDVKVQAVNGAGAGAEKSVTGVLTKESVPTIAPSTPVVESKTSRQIIFKWTAASCKDWNGPDGKYRYLIKRNEVKSGLTTDMRVQIDGLSPHTAYSFSIALQNSQGSGPYSSEVTVTTNEEASGQVASMSVEKFATSIKVKWTPPPSPNGRITHYRLGLKHLRIGPVSWACTTGISSSWVYKDTTGPAVHEDTLSTCAYCMYDVKVQAVNGAGAGAEKTTTGILTKASAPTVAPPTPRVKSVKSREVTFTWNAMPCQNRSGASMKYPFRLTTLNGQVKEAGVRDSSTTVTLTGLIPYTTYKFQIAFRNEAGTGPYGVEVSVTTDEEKPRAPSVKKAGAQLDSISVTVTPPDPPHGKITKYTIEMWPTSDDRNVTSVEVAASNNTRKFDKLTPITNYKFKAKASTSKGDGPWSSQISIKTIEGLPDPPATFKITKATDTSLEFKWTEPKFPNGVLRNYKLTCSVESSFLKDVNDNKAKYKAEITTAPDSRETTLTDLQSATKYLCELRAQTSKGYGQPASKEGYTKPKRMPVSVSTKLASAITVTKTTKTTITIKVGTAPSKSTPSGKVTAVHIGVKLTSAKSLKRRKRAVTALTDEEHKQLTDYLTAKNAGLTSYIAAALAPDFTGSLVIGDGNTHGGYQNPPLIDGETYDLLYGIVTRVGEYNTSSFSALGKEIKVGGTNIVAIAVPIVLIIVLVAVIVPVVIILLRRRRKASRGKDVQDSDDIELKVDPMDSVDDVDGTSTTTATDGPVEDAEIYMNLAGIDHSIPCNEIHQHNLIIKDEKAEDFANEYKSIPDRVKPSTVGEKPTNKSLNRYRNIIAYDHSRVILKPFTKGEKINDYINANYIDGYGQQKKVFIASQGPRKDHVPDFWRMVWQKGCTTIVMLTNLIENTKDKCTQYWPEKEKETETYGPITVSLEKEETFVDYVKRDLLVSKDEENRVVRQYHFISWPDHGVPAMACTMLNLRDVVMKNHGKKYGLEPLFVHCSAGVGRTGTFIAIDILIRQGQAEGKVNIYDCVANLRKQRPNMVQALVQYMHIHDAMAEFFHIGATKIPSESFPAEYKKLVTTAPDADMCKLQTQYEQLDYFLKEVTAGKKTLTDYADKNRTPDIVPSDASRPILSGTVEGWVDYINAAYLTGFGDKDNYLATQMPLPDTVKDIWRLVDDLSISTVVMMNTVNEDDKLSPIYWPKTSEKMEFGPVVVEGKEVDTSNSDITVSDFEVSRVGNARGFGGKAARPVRHFHLLNWPDGQSTPASPESIVQLLEMVEKWQQRMKNKKILVQCLDGASQSGVFCVAHSVIEKVKIDHEVDVFQYVRLLRTNRPQLVSTYEQYMFIHDVALKYLSQFDIYANFQ